jgi:hypothetical protein
LFKKGTRRKGIKMKVLVATKEGQGKRRNDFCFCAEGELVKAPITQCDGEKTDGKCGCRRSMSGFDSLKSTTTFKVIDSALSKEQFMAALRDAFNRSGFKFEEHVYDEIELEGSELLRIAGIFPVNVVLEKRGKSIKIRTRG